VETGVALFGVRAPGCHITLAAVGPGPEAIHRRSLFQPDTDYLNQEYLRLKETLPRLEWLGSLHVHPRCFPNLSEHDRRTVRELLARRHLSVLGLGSVGSALALMAARAGVGRFTLIDRDHITPENIGRHMCDLSALDQPKVQAVAELIRRINPTAQVNARSED